MALLALIAVVLISLAVHCYTKADEKLKKRIARFNGVIYAIFIILLLLSFHQNMKIEKYPDKYDIYSGNIFSAWTYKKSDKEYYYIHKTAFLENDNYAVPKKSCKLSPVARIRGIVQLKVFALPGTCISHNNTVKVDGYNYILADSVIMIEPDYDYLSGFYTIIAGIILLIYNSVTLLTINDQNDSKAEQNDSKAEQRDSKVEQGDSKAEQSDSEAEQNDSEVEQNSSEVNPPAKK